MFAIDAFLEVLVFGRVRFIQRRANDSNDPAAVFDRGSQRAGVHALSKAGDDDDSGAYQVASESTRPRGAFGRYVARADDRYSRMLHEADVASAPEEPVFAVVEPEPILLFGLHFAPAP